MAVVSAYICVPSPSSTGFGLFLAYADQPPKDRHDPNNHDGVIIHLKPDILECEVKWALGSSTTNKTNGGNGIPVELFQILKDDAIKDAGKD